MKRHCWLIAFVIVVLSMPLAAFAADEAAPEQRVEVRVVRGEDGREIREERREMRHDADGEGAGEWREQGGEGEHELRFFFDGMGEGGHGMGGGGGEWMKNFDWRGMHDRAGGMMHGIRDRALRIDFHPEVEESALALGMNNKAIRADTINININIGDVSFTGNSVEGGDVSEVLGMIMKMMLKAHGQDGMGMGMGMGPQGPGMAGPGPQWDGGPGMPPMPPMEWHEGGDGHGEGGGHGGHGEMGHGEGNGHGGHAGNSHGDDGGHGGRRMHSDAGSDEQALAMILPSEGSEEHEVPGVRSPYYDFYFGNGQAPQAAAAGQPVLTTAQRAGNYTLGAGSASAASYLRPELLDVLSQIPEDVPTEFIEMIFELGQLAWEDPALRERLEMLSTQNGADGSLASGDMLRAYLEQLATVAEQGRDGQG